MKRWMTIWMLVWLLVACEVPGTAMPDDGPPVAVSEEAARSLEAKFAEAAAAQGASTVTMTQEEVTSYLALRLASAEVPLTNPQVYFKEDGGVVVRGQVDYQGQIQPIRVVARPSASDGTLVVDIVEGRIGPVPVPGPLLDQIEGNLADAILAGQQYARLDEVRVDGGQLTLTGQRQ